MKKICIGLLAGFLLTTAVPAFAVTDAYLGASYPNVCVGQPIPREEIGGTRFPVAPKYKHLNWLGQLFTADDCGDIRLTELYGGEHDGESSLYEPGSSIVLKKLPTKYLRRLLQTIGYTSSDNIRWTTAPTELGVNETLRPVRNFLLLKTYYRKIQSSDCTNCG